MQRENKGPKGLFRSGSIGVGLRAPTAEGPAASVAYMGVVRALLDAVRPVKVVNQPAR